MKPRVYFRVYTVDNQLVQSVFLVRTFWRHERPTSTGTVTESSNYPNSQYDTDSRQSRDNLMPSNLELKSENLKLQFEVERLEKDFRNQELNHQSVINQLKRENSTANNDRIERENELIASKLRIDQLEFEIERFEIEREKSNSVTLRLENQLAECQSRIEQLQSQVQQHQQRETKYQSDLQAQQAQLQSATNRNKTLESENRQIAKKEQKCQSDLVACKSRIQQLESQIQQHKQKEKKYQGIENKQQKYQSDFKQEKAKCESLEKQNNELVKFLGHPSIEVKVIFYIVTSLKTDKKWEQHYDKNYSGHYQMVEIVNNRLAYKVS